jgi:predicted dehydrogenase
MSAPGEIAIGIVGCGRLAENAYVPAIAGVPGLVLAAVADPDPDRAAGLAAAAPSAVPFDDPAAMLERTDLAGVIICSPPAHHLAAARLASAASLPALIEKPPAADLAGAEALAALPGPRWIGFNRRFTAGRALRDGIGGIGPGARWSFEAELRYRRRSWNPVGDLGDAWLDLGPHLVDLALWLDRSERLAPVAARIERETASVELRGARATVTLACAIDAPHRERYRVRDSGGSSRASYAEGGLRGVLRGRRGPHPLLASIGEQVAEFAQRLRGQAPADPLLASAADGAAVMGLLDAARRLGAGVSGR